MAAKATRNTDDLVLRLIEMRASGKSSYEVARHFGLTSEFVRTATYRVMKADLDKSGESQSAVLAHYW